MSVETVDSLMSRVDRKDMEIKRLGRLAPEQDTVEWFAALDFVRTTRPALTCAVSYGASRVYLLTQLVSQVLPPSSENACSDCAVSGVIPQMENRTRMVLPLIDSWS